MAIAYIGLGSNLGNREANLRMALQLMTRLSRIKAVSSLYESDAFGPDQPPYYNAAYAIETGLEPLSLMRFLQTVEHEIGRRPGGSRWGPRPIDLDILLYDDRVVDGDELTIPHPRLPERAFVLMPLAEIAPEVRHPTLGQSIGEMATAFGSAGVRLLADAGWDRVAGTQGRVRL